jgi:hypothetical protein
MPSLTPTVSEQAIFMAPHWAGCVGDTFIYRWMRCAFGWRSKLTLVHGVNDLIVVNTACLSFCSYGTVLLLHVGVKLGLVSGEKGKMEYCVFTPYTTFS